MENERGIAKSSCNFFGSLSQIPVAWKYENRFDSVARLQIPKWASCSTRGFLNFNSDLLDYEKDVGDYVIVHELLHFFVPNHGKLWKSLMRAHLGDYEKTAEKLKNAQHHPKVPANEENT